MHEDWNSFSYSEKDPVDAVAIGSDRLLIGELIGHTSKLRLNPRRMDQQGENVSRPCRSRKSHSTETKLCVEQAWR